MSQFDEETGLLPLGDEQWSGHVHPSWNIGTNPNGGYLLSLVLTALGRLVPEHHDPLAITAHYLRPGCSDAPCTVEARVVRSGRNLNSVRGTLSQDNTARLAVIATFGALGEPAPAQLTIPAPSIPPPEQCVGRSGQAQGIDLPILDRLEVRLHPDDAKAGASGHARITGWVRLRDGREPDSRAAVLFADAFPPSIFSLLGPIGWVPTLEMTVHVRRRPSPGWMLGQFDTRDLANGHLVEDGLLWDAAGELVAQVRQLALVRAPG
ncbi:MAG: thioesterase family protein [Burkholderiales bacterium]|nr:thioesterase family protein [Burkholderiales bacterium]